MKSPPWWPSGIWRTTLTIARTAGRLRCCSAATIWTASFGACESRVAQCRLVVLRRIEVSQALQGWINVGQLVCLDNSRRHLVKQKHRAQSVRRQQALDGINHLNTVNGSQGMEQATDPWHANGVVAQQFDHARDKRRPQKRCVTA